MRILAAEPYATLSHRLFLEGLARHSAHDVELVTLPARTWKWRMRTASLHFARVIFERGPWDLVLASDFLNLAETLAILPDTTPAPPAVVYFHENQLTYPLQDGEARDVHHALTHVHAILAARHALFNSAYHRREFLDAAAVLLAQVPEVDTRPTIAALHERSSVLPVGVDVPAGAPNPPRDAPTILWPHRWEYDKDPAAFLAALVELERRRVPFRLRLLGQRFRVRPPELDELEHRFADRIRSNDFLDRAGYLDALRASDVVVSTARHEFFGLATLEALRSGALPVLPSDLAYPELLPEDLRTAPFLYERTTSVVDALERALDIARRGTRGPERARLVEWTDRFTWEVLAPEFDAALERAVCGR
jgi:glycosyltransferase involved in cell wall biosynthesis